MPDEKTVGIYIDAPNVNILLDDRGSVRGQDDFHSYKLLQNLAKFLDSQVSKFGKIVKKYVFMDQTGWWSYKETKKGLKECGYMNILSPLALTKTCPISKRPCYVKRHPKRKTKGVYCKELDCECFHGGKSQTDTFLICQMLEDLYSENGPDVFVLLSGDKDFVRPLHMICQSGKKCIVMHDEHLAAKDIHDFVDQESKASFKDIRSEYKIYIKSQ